MSREMFFESYPRKVYKRTFLNTVFVVFSYSIEERSNEALSSINQFLRDNFNAPEDITNDTFLRGISFDSEEKGVSYFFSAKHLGVKYFKDDYVSFQQTMMPLIYPLMAFMRNTIHVKEIDSIEIRKVNIWTTKYQTDDPVNEKSLVSSFLSSDLISSLQTGSDPDLRDAHVLDGRTGSFSFTLKYGFKDAEHEGEKYCGLILDEIVKSNQILITEVETALVDTNNTLYNIFHWSVSKQTLTYMDKEV